MRKLTFVLVVCLLMAGASFAQVYVPLLGPNTNTTIQFKNNGSNYGTPLKSAGSSNLAPGCTATGTSPNFTITCTASGTVNPGTATHLAYYATSAAAVNDMGADFTFNTHTLAGGASSILDLSAGTLKPPGGGTLTLGTANINWATLGTGIVINTTTTGAKSVIAAVGAKCYPFQGSGGTGCDTPTGAGTVNSGNATHLAYYASSTNAVSDMGADYTFNRPRWPPFLPFGKNITPALPFREKTLPSTSVCYWPFRAALGRLSH